MKNTKGTWAIGRTYNDMVCTLDGKTIEKCKLSADGSRIVKCVNMHDELVDAIRSALDMDPLPWTHSHEFFKKLLTKSEEQ